MLRNMFRKTYTKIDTKYRPVSQEGKNHLFRKVYGANAINADSRSMEDVKNNCMHAPNAAATYSCLRRINAYGCGTARE